ncbi:MAG: sulfatase-like hydrolase/transferase, partial [Thermoanaerobaculia bacterium]
MSAHALLLAVVLASEATVPGRENPSLVLVTLDTTRADYVGRVEDGAAVTPNLDALARSGVRFTRALTASPLTLPAHCSLMTGADPPAHGVRDNGVSALPADLPTLAAALSAQGYQSAAFVASRVLDRRFGLARGFALYDDAMVAEQVGEQGYPERNAEAVTDAALAWA